MILLSDINTKQVTRTSRQECPGIPGLMEGSQPRREEDFFLSAAGTAGVPHKSIRERKDRCIRLIRKG